MTGSSPSVMEAEKLSSALIDEDALIKLDEAAKNRGIATDLLRTTPARDIRAAIETALALLEGLDYQSLLSKQGRIARLVGADVEGRLKFELASQQVLLAMQQLRQAAANGTRVTALLRAARNDLADDQARLEAAVAWAQHLHAVAAERADPFMLARFERRLASMIAMCSANVVTGQQMALAEEVLKGLLDRATDVDTILLPLWQHNMLALAHSAPGRPARVAADAFGAVQARLIAYLKHGQSP